MIAHAALSPAQLFGRLRAGRIRFAGNRQLRIYGRLDCASGRRMRVQNRVFFASEAEAWAQGYRPCGNCLRAKHRLWRDAKVPHRGPLLSLIHI